jgi:hypothetical protein
MTVEESCSNFSALVCFSFTDVIEVRRKQRRDRNSGMIEDEKGEAMHTPERGESE